MLLLRARVPPLNPGAALYPLGHPGAVLQMEPTAITIRISSYVNVTSKVNSAISLTVHTY